MFRNFTGYDNTYTLYLTEYWENSATTTDTSGVRFSNITFQCVLKLRTSITQTYSIHQGLAWICISSRL